MVPVKPMIWLYNHALFYFLRKISNKICIFCIFRQKIAGKYFKFRRKAHYLCFNIISPF